MQRDALDDLFAYTDFAWARLAKAMEDVPANVFMRPVDGSGWPNLQRAFLHVVGAYDYLINDVLGLGKRIRAREELHRSVTAWDTLQSYRGDTRAAFRRALEVPDEQLLAKKTYDFDFGSADLSKADILANLLVHEVGHRGDIGTLFHQLGLKQLLLDYLLFIARPDEFIADAVD
jgi:uncharacterized damage-inducible protein DinB